jgi:hypothetical protein
LDPQLIAGQIIEMAGFPAPELRHDAPLWPWRLALDARLEDRQPRFAAPPPHSYKRHSGMYDMPRLTMREISLS